MKIPTFFIKIYHILPLPKRIKKSLRKMIYSLLVPFLKKIRFLKTMDGTGIDKLREVTGIKENIGICSISTDMTRRNFLLSYPMMYFVVSVLEEILEEKIYFKYYKLREDDFVIDVGSNIGIFSILSSILVGPLGSVISIEPDPFNVGFLELNKKINNLSNIEIINKGVWSNKDEKNFYINDLNSAASSIYNGYSNKIKIDVNSLDNILSRFNIGGRSIFLKMDIEGAEAEAIEGMVNILKHPNLKGCIAAYHKIKDDGGRVVRADSIIEPILKENGFKTTNEKGLIYFWR